jgi:hypothetical protein
MKSTNYPLALKKQAICALGFLIFTSFFAIAQTAQEEAIKKVIVNETEQFLNNDYAAWSASFVQAPYFIWSVTNGGEAGDVITNRGWEEFNKAMKTGWFDANPEAWTKEMRKSKVSRLSWNIQIRGNVAWVSYTQRSETPEQKVESTETRVLERIKGVWRIAMQTTLTDFKDATPPIRSKY